MYLLFVLKNYYCFLSMKNANKKTHVETSNLNPKLPRARWLEPGIELMSTFRIRYIKISNKTAIFPTLVFLTH